jgi:hypothetical protein
MLLMPKKYVSMEETMRLEKATEAYAENRKGDKEFLSLHGLSLAPTYGRRQEKTISLSLYPV